uniref:RanBP2-type domain-containing protein n=1 Tax=Chromera velia CCMP2878 TaxID=1169474 RepID=A0A0G4H2T6_9ALVE|eukprot:Cvel_24431.t1-p1 / transcript=Cvel_24431.t1 / gene=Cvel_24431 / organism=Chromera_velia_CCMP2878 / gene_product=hypothetical protein / transcript_product=hypothetical protein / location=Cvel_scaffold2640:7367-10492(-) / protein_length=754 / sequence_SO=supercontig / SO=protein_coding / is_pseudo=false
MDSGGPDALEAALERILLDAGVNSKELDGPIIQYIASAVRASAAPSKVSASSREGVMKTVVGGGGSEQLQRSIDPNLTPLPSDDDFFPAFPSISMESQEEEAKHETVTTRSDSEGLQSDLKEQRAEGAGLGVGVSEESLDFESDLKGMLNTLLPSFDLLEESRKTEVVDSMEIALEETEEEERVVASERLRESLCKSLSAHPRSAADCTSRPHYSCATSALSVRGGDCRSTFSVSPLASPRCTSPILSPQHEPAGLPPHPVVGFALDSSPSPPNLTTGGLETPRSISMSPSNHSGEAGGGRPASPTLLSSPKRDASPSAKGGVTSTSPFLLSSLSYEKVGEGGVGREVSEKDRRQKERDSLILREASTSAGCPSTSSPCRSSAVCPPSTSSSFAFFPNSSPDRLTCRNSGGICPAPSPGNSATPCLCDGSSVTGPAHIPPLALPPILPIPSRSASVSPIRLRSQSQGRATSTLREPPPLSADNEPRTPKAPIPGKSWIGEDLVWECGQCKAVNPVTFECCEGCAAPRPPRQTLNAPAAAIAGVPMALSVLGGVTPSDFVEETGRTRLLSDPPMLFFRAASDECMMPSYQTRAESPTGGASRSSNRTSASAFAGNQEKLDLQTRLRIFQSCGTTEVYKHSLSTAGGDPDEIERVLQKERETRQALRASRGPPQRQRSTLPPGFSAFPLGPGVHGGAFKIPPGSLEAIEGQEKKEQHNQEKRKQGHQRGSLLKERREKQRERDRERERARGSVRGG